MPLEKYRIVGALQTDHARLNQAIYRGDEGQAGNAIPVTGVGRTRNFRDFPMVTLFLRCSYPTELYDLPKFSEATLTGSIRSRRFTKDYPPCRN